MQTGRMPRLIWVFAGRTLIFVGFVMSRLMYTLNFLHVSKDLLYSVCDVSMPFLWMSLSMTKTYKITSAPREDSDQPTQPCSLMSVHWLHQNVLGPWLPIEHPARLIRPCIILQQLIWVYLVCQTPVYWKLGIKGLNRTFSCTYQCFPPEGRRGGEITTGN